MVRWHYSSARDQALSFLLTIGTKALVMTEFRQVESNKLLGINEEAQIRKVIVSQERIRSIRRNIVEKVPLLVWKWARNGVTRPIEIIVKSAGKRYTVLEWRSKLNYAKRFEVHDDTLINRKIQDNVSEGDIVRFKNRKRFLDLQFKIKTEADAFLLVIQSYVPTVNVIM